VGGRRKEKGEELEVENTYKWKENSLQNENTLLIIEYRLTSTS